MPSDHLILCCLLLLPPSIFPSIRVFSSESVLPIRWPKYWSFSFSISPPSEYSELISFRMDWLDLLAVQGTLKSLLQHHSSKASILRCSAFLIVQTTLTASHILGIKSTFFILAFGALPWIPWATVWLHSVPLSTCSPPPLVTLSFLQRPVCLVNMSLISSKVKQLPSSWFSHQVLNYQPRPPQFLLPETHFPLPLPALYTMLFPSQLWDLS